MGNVIKYLLPVLAILLVGAWIATVNKSCKSKTSDPLVNEQPSSTTDAYEETETTNGEDANLEDLYEEVVGEEEETGTDATSDQKEADALRGELLAKAAAKEDQQAKGVEEMDATDKKTAPPRAATDKKFMVIAGSYLSEYNAKNDLKTLKKKGFPDAEVIVFDHSQYHTICADRTNSLTQANSIRDRIRKIDGFGQAYVHRKRFYKKK